MPITSCAKLASDMVRVRSAFSPGGPFLRLPLPSRRSSAHCSPSMSKTTRPWGIIGVREGRLLWVRGGSEVARPEGAQGERQAAAGAAAVA